MKIENSDTSYDVNGWPEWLASHRAIGAKLLGASSTNKEAYFLVIHAATEAMLRRILLVGLRLNKVTYVEANDWLFHNDMTPDKEKYPKLFDQLFLSKKVTWNGTVASDADVDRLWGLWLGYSKIIRNHISHGVRKYPEEWLQCGINVDQEFLLRLDKVLVPIIGGSVCADLTKLNPRLPIGFKGNDLIKITGNKKPRKPRPPVPFLEVKNVIAALTPRVG